MANYQISATVTAQVQGFQQGMNAVVSSSGQADMAVTTMSTDISRNIANVNRLNLSGFQRALAAGQISIQRTTQAANAMGPALARSAAAVNRSSTTYMNLGRVLQDLPFGFVGIQNNLTQLIPAAGLAGLAFSALISAITFAQVGTSAWTRGLDGNTKALKTSKKSADEYVESLNQLDQVQVKGAQNALKEVTELKTLYSITQDTTVSMSQRKEAVDALQQQYPSYFKNIKDEAFLTGAASGKYNELTSAIIATGKARAAQDLIVKNSSRQLENTNKILDLEKQLEKSSGDSAKLRAKAEGQIASTREFTLNKAIVVDTQRRDIQKQINNLKTDSNLLDTRNLELTKAITSEVKKGADLSGGIGDMAKEAARPKLNNPQLDKLGGTQKDFIDPTFAYRQAQGMRDQLKMLDEYQSGIAVFADNLTDSQERAITQMMTFNAGFTQALETLGKSTVVEGMATGFSAIGAALYEGANIFEAAGQALLQTVSGFLSELGQMLIQKGIASIAAGVALNIILPGSGAKNIVGGAALVAAGAALSLGSGLAGAAASGRKSPKNNVTAFANGGIVSGPTNALIGEYSNARSNPEVVAPLDKLRGMIGDNSPTFIIEQRVTNKGLALSVRKGFNEIARS